MKPGYFLDVEESVGDAFTYRIINEKILKKKHGRHKHLVRSVIRLRSDRDDKKTPHVSESNGKLIFTDCHGNELQSETTSDYDDDESLSNNDVDDQSNSDSVSTFDTAKSNIFRCPIV